MGSEFDPCPWVTRSTFPCVGIEKDVENQSLVAAVNAMMGVSFARTEMWRLVVVSLVGEPAGRAARRRHDVNLRRALTVGHEGDLVAAW